MNFSRSLCLLAFLFFIPAKSYPAEYSRTRILMGDVPVSVTVRNSSSDTSRLFRVMEEAFDRARFLESLWSHFQPQSDISRLNRGAGWIIVDPLTVNLLEQAKNFSARTAGAFDITFSSPSRLSSSDDIRVDAGRNRVRLARRGLKLDVSGIAKGLIIDEMSAVLSRAGYGQHLVNAGGDLYASGSWVVGMRDPKGKRGSLKRLRIQNKGVSSSGNYERGVHLYDPSTGKPVQKLVATTAIADRAAESGVISVAAFVLGPEAVKKIKPVSRRVRIWILDSLRWYHYSLHSKREDS